jgi:hypothetical protein
MAKCILTYAAWLLLTLTISSGGDHGLASQKVAGNRTVGSNPTLSAKVLLTSLRIARAFPS